MSDKSLDQKKKTLTNSDNINVGVKHYHEPLLARWFVNTDKFPHFRKKTQ